MGIEFTKEQVTALCNGTLPRESGFDWSRVDHFMLEAGVFQPYAGRMPLPGPAIAVKTEISPW